jgi:hypothetical protein
VQVSSVPDRSASDFSGLTKRVGISRHIEVQDFTPVVTDDKKAVENTKRVQQLREAWAYVSVGTVKKSIAAMAPLT